MSNNVRDFGAFGDGIHDDTAAINSVLALQGSVFIPAGEYLISAALNVSSDTALFGDGPATELRRALGANCHVIRIEGSDITIARLLINGNRIVNDRGQGITTAGLLSDNVHIERVTAIECPADGIALGANLSRNVSIEKCTVSGCGKAGITVRNGHAIGCRFQSNDVRHTGEMNIGVTSRATGMRIIGNDCDTTGTGDNITCYGVGSDNMTIMGNTCRNGGSNGIHIGGDCVTITGNTIESPHSYGIQLRHSGEADLHDMTCTGNTIRNAGRSGIWADRLHGGTIVGNAIRDSVEHGIWLKSCDTVVASHNSIVGFGGDPVSATKGWLNAATEGNVFKP